LKGDDWGLQLPNERSRGVDRAKADAHAAAMRAADALRGLLGGLEVQVQNATSNPRLVAALDANVDDETLKDLLENEGWWEPVRRAVEGYALVRDGPRGLSFRLPPGFEVGSLVEKVRMGAASPGGPKPVSELRGAAGKVLAAAAVAIPSQSRGTPPVLLITKLVDIGALSPIAERAAGVVGISDGRRLLVVAGTAALAGEAMPELRRVVAMPAPGVAAAGDPSAAVAAVPAGAGLALLIYVRSAGAGAGGLPGGLSGPVIAVAILGLVLAVFLFILLGRATPEEATAVPQPPVRPGVTERHPASVTSIGRYILVDRIGQGGMAEIYSALSSGEGGFRRPLVIKRLRAELANDPAAVAQFTEEATLLAALHHPNIVAVHDFGKIGTQYYLAEEYVVGRNFSKVIRKAASRQSGLPSSSFVAHVGHELLKALEYAHNRTGEDGRALGIVHRDVSPDNVMVSAQGEVKLLDFGVVKTSRDGQGAAEESGVAKGNVGFMSPEQARGEDIDARADLYAVGLILFFGLTGRPMYDAEMTYGMLNKAGAGPAPDDLRAIDSFSQPWSALLRRAFAPRIGDRFQTAREMQAAVEPLAAGGAQMTVVLMSELYGRELEAETRRLQTFLRTTTTAQI
jgi:tRNA A-37 threonylcarbamoyl transferase component Bud32